MRWGRGFRQGTQYQALYRNQPAFSLSGSGAFSIAGAGSIVVVSSPILSVTSAPHRFRSAQVPQLTDLEAVQRHMQRSLDEVARAVNPLRSVPDGGTGLEEVSAGGMLLGTGFNKMEAVPIGPATYLWTSNGVTASWQAPPAGAGGEANTATNVGVGGVSIVNGKVGVDLQFRSVNAGSAKITVTLDAPNKEVDIDVVVGVTANSVCVGNDARLSDARTPLAHTHPASDITTDLLFSQLPQVATAVLLGRSTAGVGDIEQLTVGSGLTLAAGVLSSSGGSPVVDRTQTADLALAADASLVTVGDYQVVGTAELFIPASAEMWIR